MKGIENVYYDETSSTCLRWAVDIRGGEDHRILMYPAHSEAGCFKKTDITVHLGGKSKKVHIVVWTLHNGAVPEGCIVDHYDGNPWHNKIKNLRATTHAVNARNKKISSRNKTGITGVTAVLNSETGCITAYRAVSKDHLSSKYKWKNFSCKKYGQDEAFNLACECRADMINQLNQQGAGYTERHGL